MLGRDRFAGVRDDDAASDAGVVPAFREHPVDVRCIELRKRSARSECIVPVVEDIDNVEVADKATVAQAPAVRSAVREAEAELGDTGRILLRPSGTEQIVRVMVEAADEDTARQVAHRVAKSVSAEG